MSHCEDTVLLCMSHCNDTVCHSVMLCHCDDRNRDDTVRSIVSSLIEDSNSELLDELVKTQPGPLDDSYTSDDQTDNWQIWQPDPVDAIPGEQH